MSLLVFSFFFSYSCILFSNSMLFFIDSSLSRVNLRITSSRSCYYFFYYVYKSYISECTLSISAVFSLIISCTRLMSLNLSKTVLVLVAFCFNLPALNQILIVQTLPGRHSLCYGFVVKDFVFFFHKFKNLIS